MRWAAPIMFILCLAPLAAGGEPPLAGLAAGQLRQAELLLGKAKEALARQDYLRARELAAQAGLDARLAYGMTDSAFIRRDAVAVHAESARLRWRVAGAQVTSVAPSPTVGSSSNSRYRR